MLIDMSELSSQEAYFAMTQTVLPRPVAWALTENDDQSLNLAPFSFFNAINSDPPLLMFSVGVQPDGTAKDTLINIQERPDFVVNIASVNQLPDLNASSAALPYGTSEVEANQIALADTPGFSMPRVANSKIAMMCRRYRIDEIGNKRQALIFGEIISLYVADDCVEIDAKGRLKVYAERIEPLARLGAGEYASFGDVLEAKRPD